MTPDAALAAVRFGGNLAALFLWGATGYLWLLIPSALRLVIWQRLHPWLLGATLLAGLCSLLLLPIGTAQIGNGWADALDADLLLSVATETSVGTSWQVRMLGLIALCIAQFMPWRIRLPVLLLASCLFLCALTLTGHATMNSGGMRVLQQSNDLLHVLSAGAWFGALLPVAMTLRHLGEYPHASEARLALSRFSLAGHLAVALVLVSGIVNMLMILGSLPSDLGVNYQRLLVIKIALVCLMVLGAVCNRYYLVPRLARLPSARASLAAGTILEIVWGLLVIALVAWFGMLDPFGQA
jgi:putative copper resistance protein D